MNKKIQIITSTILLILMLGVQVSYAISGTNNEIGFFTVNSEEIEQKETLKITFDLNKIEYDNFKIALNSNLNNNELFTNDNVTINEESNAVVINIDKTKLNLNKIEMCYVVPENAEINSKIQLNVKVITEEEIESQDDEGNITTTKQEKVALEESQNVTIVEKSKSENGTETENKDNNKTDDAKQEKETSTDKKQNDSKENEDQDSKKQEESNKPNNAQVPTSNSNNKSNGFSNNSSNKSMTTVTTKNGENKETATYNGSSNNYLKKLKVKGISLNTKFNKENTTYFINVTDTSSLKITATAEDDDAKVVITGNDNIKQGTNKILIAVTAENGNVRYYRIFVNCTEK